ncbi:MAG: DnaJ domain-containing protein [Desulfobulbaceae bacterium]|nr:DnaJ domain-containing protein [Desulfobulbaceae bacterium]
MNIYRVQGPRGPGCGGCLIILLLFALLTGGTRGLVNLFGALVFSGALGFLLLVGLFYLWGYWISQQIDNYQKSQTESHNRFVELLVGILMKIAAQDGEVTKEEIQTINNFFRYHLGYSQVQMAWVKEMIKAARQSTTPLEALLAEFRHSSTINTRLILVELIYQMIHTRQPVAEQALRQARDIARFLGLSEYELRSIEGKYQFYGQSGGSSRISERERALAVLGLAEGASEEEIKQAYRALSMQYHPDKVQHLGAEFQRVAEAKMKEINAAYDYLKKHGN